MPHAPSTAPGNMTAPSPHYPPETDEAKRVSCALLAPVVAMCGHLCGLLMTATTAMPEAVRTGLARSCGSSMALCSSGTAAIISTSFGCRVRQYLRATWFSEHRGDRHRTGAVRRRSQSSNGTDREGEQGRRPAWQLLWNNQRRQHHRLCGFWQPTPACVLTCYPWGCLHC